MSGEKDTAVNKQAKQFNGAVEKEGRKLPWEEKTENRNGRSNGMT